MSREFLRLVEVIWNQEETAGIPLEVQRYWVDVGGKLALKRRNNALQNLRPIAWTCLPKQACRGVPGGGLQFLHPAPVRQVGQQNPYRLVHGAGEMRDAGVCRDHEIEARDQRGGLG